MVRQKDSLSLMFQKEIEELVTWYKFQVQEVLYLKTLKREAKFFIIGGE